MNIKKNIEQEDITGKLTSDEMQAILEQMGEKAIDASRALAAFSTAQKNHCLMTMATELEEETKIIKEANRKDLTAGAANGLSDAMLDRLKLDDGRIAAMANGLREVAAIEDPVGKKLSSTIRPNGIKIEKVSVPIGVIGIVYESRPNVTADAAGLCLKAGNAVMLRGGSEAINSNIALAHCLNRAGIMAGLPDGVVQLIPWTDRRAVSLMLKMNRYLDLIIPRGGEGLIRAVVEQSTIPVIKHYKGVCNIYVDRECDREMAKNVIKNAKCQRPGVCNAVENVLINREIAEDFVPAFFQFMRKNKVELRGDREFLRHAPQATAAADEDYYTEYLDLILAVKIVENVEEAVRFINKYGSRHSDGIITTNPDSAFYFMSRVDSATVYHNASTRFTDGGEFGMGAEIGVSTDKLHARGPMGLQELTSYKYLIFGDGQIRG